MNPKPFRSAILLAGAVAVATLSGCHKKSAPPPYATAPTPSVPTASITAEPSTIDAGQNVVLRWQTSNATSVTIDGIGPVSTSGTQTVQPTASTVFHLSARNAAGSQDADARVTVREAALPTPPPPTSGDDVTEAAFHQNVQDIFFDYDSSDLNPAGQTSASQAASYLSAHSTVKILIGGYCDSRGSAEYNLALGETRANAAKTALTNAGVSPNRIRVISYGKEKQFCFDQSETCWQQNRRAQFSIDK